MYFSTFLLSAGFMYNNEAYFSSLMSVITKNVLVFIYPFVFHLGVTLSVCLLIIIYKTRLDIFSVIDKYINNDNTLCQGLK